MGVLTADEIKKKDDVKRERVDVPEWGTDSFVFVRTIGGTERDQLDHKIFSDGGRNKIGLRAFVACMCVCDENGKDLFDSKDMEWLSKKSGAALDRILDVAFRLNGLTQPAVEEVEKNSEAAPSGSSG